MGLMKTIVSFLFILFVLISTSYSQRVIPSDRVVNHVNVRELPITSSDIVGALSPGESAELIESISSWYKIRCDDGDIGYVSKAWTMIGDGISEAEGKDDLVIGSWNIKWFGFYIKDRHDYPAMADIVQTMDVLAIQELRGPRSIKRLDSLKAELNRRGYKYERLFSDQTGYSGDVPGYGGYLERYAFLYDIDRVELVDPNQPYKFIDTPIVDNQSLRQVPISVDFKVKNGNGFDFKVVTVHTVYNPPLHNVRASEFRFMHNWMNEQLEDPSVSEKNIFIIGDFNANPDGQPNYFDTIIFSNNKYRVVFNEPAASGEPPIRTTIMVPKVDDSSKFLSPLYDHLLLSRNTDYALNLEPVTWASGVIGVIEFDQEQKWQDYGEADSVKRNMSDHRPIWIKLDYNTEDRD